MSFSTFLLYRKFHIQASKHQYLITVSYTHLSFLVRFLIILFAGAEGQQSLQLAISCLISYTYNIKVINMKKMLISFLLMVMITGCAQTPPNIEKPKEPVEQESSKETKYVDVYKRQIEASKN